MASKYNNSKQQRMLPTCRRTKRTAKLFALPPKMYEQERKTEGGGWWVGVSSPFPPHFVGQPFADYFHKAANVKFTENVCFKCFIIIFIVPLPLPLLFMAKFFCFFFFCTKTQTANRKGKMRKQEKNLKRRKENRNE